MPWWCIPAPVLSMRRQQPKISLELSSQSSTRLVLVIRLRVLLMPPPAPLLALPVLLLMADPISRVLLLPAMVMPSLLPRVVRMEDVLRLFQSMCSRRCDEPSQ